MGKTCGPAATGGSNAKAIVTSYHKLAKVAVYWWTSDVAELHRATFRARHIAMKVRAPEYQFQMRGYIRF